MKKPNKNSPKYRITTNGDIFKIECLTSLLWLKYYYTPYLPEELESIVGERLLFDYEGSIMNEFDELENAEKVVQLLQKSDEYKEEQREKKARSLFTVVKYYD